MSALASQHFYQDSIVAVPYARYTNHELFGQKAAQIEIADSTEGKE
jgi:hypothetical protein